MVRSTGKLSNFNKSSHMILFHILAIVLSSGNLGQGGPSRRDSHIGYDGFALTENQ